MQQSKLDSLIEALFGTMLGFIIQFFASYAFLHMLGIPISGSANLVLSLMMTFVSIARGYFVRRLSQKYLTTIKTKVSNYLKKEVQ